MKFDKIKKQSIEINMLYKENDQQKTEINRLKLIIALKDNENEDLKKENKNLRRNIKYLCDENIRLRYELNEVKNNDRNY